MLELYNILRQSEANDEQVDSAAESDEEPEETVQCVNHKTAIEMPHSLHGYITKQRQHHTTLVFFCP